MTFCVSQKSGIGESGKAPGKAEVSSNLYYLVCLPFSAPVSQLKNEDKDKAQWTVTWFIG